MGERFKQMLNAALNREPGKGGGSLIIPNHLTQMRLFGIRQGVEIFPLQDMENIRRDFINKLWRDNKIDLYLERYWDLTLGKGRLCFYLRPNANGGYRIYHYPKEQFKDYYDADGELIKVVIKYSYQVDSPIFAATNLGGPTKWIKLVITKSEIIRYDSDIEPDIAGSLQLQFQPTSKSINSLGWIPCVIVNNYTIQAGQDGVDEFSWLSDQLERHDRMMEAIGTNVEFFGNPTLISSRTMGELVEGGVATKPMRPTSASQAGFAGRWTGSSYKEDPFERYDPSTGLRVRRVIAGVEGNDRIGYIMPDPVSPDQTRFAAEYRENIHTALGGVDPLGINTGATAFEIKSLFGRTAATAKKRADNIYTYGLCKVFEMAIAAEELKLKRQIAVYLEIPVEIITDDGVMQLLQTGKSPSGRKLPKGFRPVGLPPLGDRTISWRWTGPVFEDSPQDILQKSIVVRNMEEVGVETIEALRFMLPDKTDKEIRRMLTGFPFREMQESGAALGQHLAILGQMLSTPNPYDPTQPLGATLNNAEVISNIIAHIQKRLNYANPNDPAADSGTYAFTPVPSSNSADASGDANSGAGSTNVAIPGNLPATGDAATGGGSKPYAGGIPDPAGYAPSQLYDLVTGQPIPATPLYNGGIPEPGTVPGFHVSPNSGASYPIAEHSATIPVPGGTIAADSYQQYASGFTPSVSPAVVYGAGIPADLADSPNIWRQLFPTFFNAVDVVSGGKRQRKRTGE